MKTNTLVTHKKLRTLGIGCVAKVKGKKLEVNFGKDDVLTCLPNVLQEIDTSKCKTISFKEVQSKAINNSFGKLGSIFIFGNEVKQYVGMGFVSLRVVTDEDLKQYKRVIH